jgi:GTP pyrophosphokinase
LADWNVVPPKERFKAVYPESFLEHIASADKDLDKDIIRKALEFADSSHNGQMRQSGEPYIVHPIGVALILMSLGMDTSSICAGLLHDVLEDTPVTVDELSKIFGETITRLVHGVTKIGKIKFSSKAEEQAENLRKMLLAMTDDVRVILIKLADRLHNMLTLGAVPPEKQKRKAQETLDVYVPLAHRLGIYKIKSEMEDLCLRYLEPNIYFKLVKEVAQKRLSRQQFVDELTVDISELLESNVIQAVVSGRPKTLYSIYKKTLKQSSDTDDIYDKIGLRVITLTVADCYSVLGLLHERWKPLQHRFKDYIAVPKANQYRSLHTTLIHPSGQVFEVQIRTEEMDRISEEGIAAHWSYKEGGGQSAEVFRQKLVWLKQIIEWHKDVADSSEFIEGLKVDLFENQVYVFTPEGKVLELPAGASPIDFAYAIHTEVGHHCVGAQVNGKMVPLTYELQNGQIVKVLTNKTSKGPSRDWLDVVKCTSAKQKIKSWLKRENRDADLLKGKDLVLGELSKQVKLLPDTDVTVASIMNSADFVDAMSHYGFIKLDALYVSVGRNEFSILSLINRLPIFAENAEKVNVERVLAKAETLAPKRPGTKGILVSGMGDMMVRFAKCCTPIFGDKIMGYVTRGRGVSVHCADCPNLAQLILDEDRQVEVEWDEKTIGRKETFLVDIKVEVYDKPNVLLKVTNIISQFKLNIYSANAKTTNKTQNGYLKYNLDVSNNTQLTNLLNAIHDLPEVVTAYRLQPQDKITRKMRKLID